MGLIFDLAIAVLALVVVGSLLGLTWTLAITAPRSVGRTQAAISDARHRVRRAESRLTDGALRVARAVERAGIGSGQRHGRPAGDESDQ